MSIQQNIKVLKAKLPLDVRLIVVSKTHSADLIKEVYDCGIRDFGENKVQELLAKTGLLPNDIRWHLIGHLQTNKVKQIINSVHLIHSVDSLKLLEEIQKQAQKNNINVNYLLQIYIATEETKFGLSFKEAEEIISAYKNGNQPNIKICGLMGMASNTEDNQLIKKEFKSLKHFFDLMKEKYFPNDTSFATISMGMSSDYGLAIEEGSNMIRLGSAIFGSRY